MAPREPYSGPTEWIVAGESTRSLCSIQERPELNKKLTRFKVVMTTRNGHDWLNGMENFATVFEEDEWSVKPILPRLLCEWDDLYIFVYQRNRVISMTRVTDLKSRGNEPGSWMGEEWND
jgi:hypothetical protein